MQALRWELNHASNATSSVYFKQGMYMTLVSVDVLEPEEGKKNVKVIYNCKNETPSATERNKHKQIKHICVKLLRKFLLPGSSVSVTVDELEGRPLSLSCVVNGMCLALIKSELETKYLVGAVTCSVDAGGSVALNPTEEQLAASKAQLTFVFVCPNKSMVTVLAEGDIEGKDYDHALARSIMASDNIFRCYRTLAYHCLDECSD